MSEQALFMGPFATISKWPFSFLMFCLVSSLENKFLLPCQRDIVSPFGLDRAGFRWPNTERGAHCTSTHSTQQFINLCVHSILELLVCYAPEGGEIEE